MLRLWPVFCGVKGGACVLRLLPRLCCGCCVGCPPCAPGKKLLSKLCMFPSILSLIIWLFCSNINLSWVSVVIKAGSPEDGWGGP
jgi:hypothetical protein